MRRCITVAVIAAVAAASLGQVQVPPKLTGDQVKTLMRDLSAYVEQNHLKTDPNSQQKGFIYEYVDTTKIGQLGQWIQGEALDSVHDGAWYGGALMQAYLATGDEYYKNFVTSNTLPLYLHILHNSDTLFADGLDPNKVAPGGGGFGKDHIYMGKKGFFPYWWDDGASVSFETKFRQTGVHPYGCVDYYMLAGKANPDFRLCGFSLGCSPHMSQDLCVMLLRTWSVLRDPKIGQAANYILENRMARRPAKAVVIAAAAAVTNNKPELLEGMRKIHDKYPSGGWFAKALKDAARTSSFKYPDEDSFDYLALIVKEGATPEVASKVIYATMSFWVTNDYFYDVTGPTPGLNNYDLKTRYMEKGKYLTYQSDDPKFPDGSRGGPQTMALSSISLQMLREAPGCWERIAEQKTAESQRVYFVDEKIVLDGKADAAYGEIFEVGDMKLQAASDLNSLYLAGVGSGDQVALTVFGDRSENAPAVQVTISKDGTAAAKLADGSEVKCEAATATSDSGWNFELKLPYQINKDQAYWATAYEAGYLAVGAGEAKKDLFFLSSEERIGKYLLAKVEGGLAVWNRIFRQVGYLPTAFVYGEKIDPTNVGRMSNYSDTGGYAHLISACSQYLIYLDGKTDWKLMDLPKLTSK